MVSTMVQKDRITLEFCIDDLGYLEETLETRAIAMSKVLMELGLPYRRYYISKSIKEYKQFKKPKVYPPDMSIAFSVECNGDYLAFAWYCYRKRMNTIISFQKSFETSDLCK